MPWIRLTRLCYITFVVRCDHTICCRSCRFSVGPFHLLVVYHPTLQPNGNDCIFNAAWEKKSFFTTSLSLVPTVSTCPCMHERQFYGIYKYSLFLNGFLIIYMRWSVFKSPLPGNESNNNEALNLADNEQGNKDSLVTAQRQSCYEWRLQTSWDFTSCHSEGSGRSWGVTSGSAEACRSPRCWLSSQAWRTSAVVPPLDLLAERFIVCWNW